MSKKINIVYKLYRWIFPTYSILCRWILRYILHTDSHSDVIRFQLFLFSLWPDKLFFTASAPTFVPLCRPLTDTCLCHMGDILKLCFFLSNVQVSNLLSADSITSDRLPAKRGRGLEVGQRNASLSLSHLIFAGARLHLFEAGE